MIPRDTFGEPSYSALMADRQAHIIVTIDTKEPIELGDFIAAFTSLSSQYQQYIAEYHPELSSEAKIFITEIRAGSIIADLIPFAKMFGLATVVPVMEQLDVIADFVEKYGAKLKGLFSNDEKAISAAEITTKVSDLNDCWVVYRQLQKIRWKRHHRGRLFRGPQEGSEGHN